MSKGFGTKRMGDRAGQRVTVRQASDRRAVRVKFGDVEIVAAAPTRELIVENVKLGTEALQRLGRRLERPGVTIRARKGVPLYAVADGEPGVLIRTLDGRTERGRIVDGVFKVIE